MKTLTITKDAAAAAYEAGDTSQKQLLERLFGNKTFQPVTERIKTYDDACKELRIKEESVLPYLSDADGPILHNEAYAKLCVIARALNEGWEPDWSNSSEHKYYPWMKYTAGSGFAFCVGACVSSTSGVGSRLCFKSRELAEYAATQFRVIYNAFFSL